MRSPKTLSEATFQLRWSYVMHLDTSAHIRGRLARLPLRLGPATTWAVRFARHGPRWMPRPVRWLPLRLVCLAYIPYARNWL